MSEKSKRVLFVATVVKTHIMTFHVPCLKMFKEMGYETAVAARNDYEDPNDCCIPFCDCFFDIPIQREPFCYNNFQCYKKLKTIIDEGEFSIIHCHTPVGGVLGRLAARAARKKSVRVIYTAHGFHFYKGAPIKNWLLYYPVEKICSHFTDVLITINKEDYALAQKKMKARCVKYVPGVGIDIEKFSGTTVGKVAKRKELGIPEDAVLLLSVGELINRKNHEMVIRALTDMEVYYLIAGEGGLRQHLQNVIDKLGANNKVKLLGFRGDVKELYEAADVFVFPSFQEGLPVSVMEAMASKLPIACSNIRGNIDLIDENGGVLFKPNDVNDCKVAIQKIISSNRQQMGAYNMEKVKAFSLKHVNDQMSAIIRSVVI